MAQSFRNFAVKLKQRLSFLSKAPMVWLFLLLAAIFMAESKISRVLSFQA
jgi:hypothetical protein